MTHQPSGTEIARPFVPARDFAVSKRFYEALGFEKLHDGEVAIFQVGATSFILQNFWQEQWAGNFMMQLIVDDLDAWWSHVSGLDLVATFGVRPPKAPEMQPWGMRTAYVVDPAGVLWHFVQRPAHLERG